MAAPSTSDAKGGQMAPFFFLAQISSGGPGAESPRRGARQSRTQRLGQGNEGEIRHEGFRRLGRVFRPHGADVEAFAGGNPRIGGELWMQLPMADVQRVDPPRPPREADLRESPRRGAEIVDHAPLRRKPEFLQRLEQLEGPPRDPARPVLRGSAPEPARGFRPALARRALGQAAWSRSSRTRRRKVRFGPRPCASQ